MIKCILNSPPLQCILASCKSCYFAPNQISKRKFSCKLSVQQISSYEQPSTMLFYDGTRQKDSKEFLSGTKWDLINTVKPRGVGGAAEF